MARTKKVLEQIENLPSKSIIKKCDLATLEALSQWCGDFKTAVDAQITQYAEAKEAFTAAANKLAEAKKEYNKIAAKLGKETIE